ncbi:hypothetical protein G9A89_015050 [Geosiphon pyriformis]|nr:hypothetical protein G9A89_015050 [Geosiphon pyriformis]
MISLWTPEEDKELCLAAKKHLNNGKVEWKTILSSGHFPGRSNGDLCVRYNSVLVYPKRGPWTKQEDEKLLSLVQSHGKKWVKISHILQRPSAAIRRYYEEYLAPGIKRGRWTEEEFNELAKAFKNYGENWEQIQLLIPGRSLRQIKVHCRYSPKVQNYYNKGKWNSVEIKNLKEAFGKYGKNWVKVSEAVDTRGLEQCRRKMLSLRESLVNRICI